MHGNIASGMEQHVTESWRCGGAEHKDGHHEVRTAQQCMIQVRQGQVGGKTLASHRPPSDNGNSLFAVSHLNLTSDRILAPHALSM